MLLGIVKNQQIQLPRKECISCIPLPQDNKYLYKSDLISAHEGFMLTRDE